MALQEVWSWLEALPIAGHIGESWWFPMLESIHVVGVTLLFGSLLMVDLRLLGLAARSYTVRTLSREMVPWTWAAFVIATLTGAALFITQANHYATNKAFQAKCVLLLLAGANMAVFHFGAYRRVVASDSASLPGSAKLAGALSLLLWVGVILAGRWVGHLS